MKFHVYTDARGIVASFDMEIAAESFARAEALAAPGVRFHVMQAVGFAKTIDGYARYQRIAAPISIAAPSS